MPYTEEEFERMKKELEDREKRLRLRMKLLFMSLPIVIVLAVCFFFDNKTMNEIIELSGISCISVLFIYFQFSKNFMDYANATKDFHNNFFN